MPKLSWVYEGWWRGQSAGPAVDGRPLTASANSLASCPAGQRFEDQPAVMPSTTTPHPRTQESGRGRRILQKAQSACGVGYMSTGWAPLPECYILPLHVHRACHISGVKQRSPLTPDTASLTSSPSPAARDALPPGTPSLGFSPLPDVAGLTPVIVTTLPAVVLVRTCPIIDTSLAHRGCACTPTQPNRSNVRSPPCGGGPPPLVRPRRVTATGPRCGQEPPRSAPLGVEEYQPFCFVLSAACLPSPGPPPLHRQRWRLLVVPGASSR